VQRIIKIRRDYNRWVADETLEDFALRFTPHGYRKWGPLRVGSTAFGAVSFLALEAIGAAITFSWGFVNAAWAILLVSLVIFITALPIAWHAARRGLDMDLLTRGAGFGYLGSTLTSLIYATFTFVFFALEAAIMAQGLELWFDLPRLPGYLVSALVIIPLVMHGVTAISRLQIWTQPIWLVLLIAPYVAVAARDPGAFEAFVSFEGLAGGTGTFSWVACGAAAAVAASLIAQVGEQVDYLRFMPEKTPANRIRWWTAVLVAGPGWIVPGAAKMLGGAFLAWLALREGIPTARALEPTQMYLIGFSHVVGGGALAVALTGLFVVISQVKINVTNAYAGSLAWSNFFARHTHSHPGRVVWLCFNVAIALLLMVMGVFEALERVLGFYSHLAVAWVGALFGDLMISKPLGLSPRQIEFRRAYLHDINPSGFGAMAVGSVLSVIAYTGVLGEGIAAASTAIALLTAIVLSPVISAVTRGRWFLAREPVDFGARHRTLRCSICRNRYESEDMAACPAYGGAICSLCCSLDARCGDRCKPDARPALALGGLLTRLLPRGTQRGQIRRLGHFLAALSVIVALVGGMLALLYTQSVLVLETGPALQAGHLVALFAKIGVGVLLVASVAAWWLVLANESRRVAQEESERQNQLLQREIDAHRQTDTHLAAAKELAERASQAKTRFLTGMSHEMRSPLNTILGYSQLMMRDRSLSAEQHGSVETILRSGEHLTGLVDGLLELSRIERGRLTLESRPIDLAEFLRQVVKMFEPLAEAKGIGFEYRLEGELPGWVNGDAKRLRQVLINLLSNAVKFTDVGGVTLKVRYQREIADIEVVDSGIGIATVDLDRIFEPFERLRPGKVEGTGLGLPISRLLVDMMGGELKVCSVPGQGSCFHVKLYLSSVAAPSSERDRGADIDGYEGERRSVLVVDDETWHRTVLRRLLAPLGFEVFEAASAAEAQATLQTRRPDLVLLDVNLTDQPGWTVCATVRALPGPRIGLLMVSGSVAQSSPERLREHDCDGFIAKPVVQAELLEAIGQCLGLRWHTRDDTVDVDDSPGAVPPPDALRELLSLSAGGFPKALRARLGEIAQESAASAAWVASLDPLLDSNPRALTALLAQALSENHRG
jgi:signal transduction histidine kinase/CheY-like chemotaxis protein